jgi:hypothetical protein
VTPLAIPLIDAGVTTGAMTGTITGITANTITNSAASWTAGALSNPATPYIIAIKSGSAVGRHFLISTATANSATTVTIDSEEASLVDLTTTGIQAGDSYSILVCDTLSTLFGDPIALGVQGGTASNGAGADIVQIQVAGQWRQYYYGTSGTPGWKRVGLNTASNNVVVRPDTLVLYNRIAATPLSLTVLGAVTDTSRRQLVRNSGVSALANPFPSGSTTLATSGLNSIGGWVSSSNSNLADIVQLQVSGAWRQYYHNGTNWRRVGLNTISDSVEIPVGAGIIVNRRGSATGSNVTVVNRPYSL